MMPRGYRSYTDNANGYSQILEYKIPGMERPATHIKNLSFGPQTNQTIVMGNTFLVDITSNQYFHFLIDTIGQYEFLKQYIPNLNIVFSSDHEANRRYVFEKEGNSVIRDFASIYNITKDDVLVLDEGGSVVFENVFYFSNVFNNFLNDYHGYNILYYPDGDDFFHYNLGLSKAAREKLLPYAAEMESKKIFITRNKENASLLRLRDLNNKYMAGTLNDDESREFQIGIARFGGVTSIYNNVTLRIQEPDELDRMEGFFKDLGYEVVDPGQYSLFEQIGMYSRATHIASMKGTGLANMIFANKDTHIIMINPNRDYRFWYHYMGKQVSDRFYEVPESEFDFDKLDGRNPDTFSLDNILNKAKDVFYNG